MGILISLQHPLPLTNIEAIGTSTPSKVGSAKEASTSKSEYSSHLTFLYALFLEYLLIISITLFIL